MGPKQLLMAFWWGVGGSALLTWGPAFIGLGFGAPSLAYFPELASNHVALVNALLLAGFGVAAGLAIWLTRGHRIRDLGGCIVAAVVGSFAQALVVAAFFVLVLGGAPSF